MELNNTDLNENSAPEDSNAKILEEQQDQNSTSIVSTTPPISISDFVSKGIFGPGGFLDSFENQNQNEITNQRQNNDVNQTTAIADAVSSISKLSLNSDAVKNLTVVVQSRGASGVSELFEAVFGIDHIIEEIFLQLDTSSLKTARLVSHRWEYFGALELQKRALIEISFSKKKLPLNEDPPNPDDLVSEIHNPKAPKFQDEDVELSMLSLIGLIQSPKSAFPCTHFDLTCFKLASPHFQYFLESIGSQIKKLKLTVPIIFSPASFEEGNMFEELRRMFVVQLPNLQEVELELWLSRRWDPGMIKWIEDSKSFLYPHCNNNNNNNNEHQQIIRLPNLKELIIRGTGPITILMFDELKAASMNLTYDELVPYKYHSFM